MTTTISDSSPRALATARAHGPARRPGGLPGLGGGGVHAGGDRARHARSPSRCRRVGRVGTTDARHLGALTHGETRVLHYLPTNLSAREIADELYLSVYTVRTHQRHVYQKLGARSRTQAVEQARDFGLLAPPPRGRMAGGGSL